MKTWQTEPNSIHYTKEKLFCGRCRKQFKDLIHVCNIGYFCWDCFYNNLPHIFCEHDLVHIIMRIVTDILFDDRKETHKLERNKMTLKLRYEVLKRDNNECVICGNTSKDSKLEIDHIIPICDNGKTVKNNLRVLCFDCNRGKGKLS